MIQAHIDKQEENGWVQVKLQGSYTDYDPTTANQVNHDDKIAMYCADAREAMRQLFQKVSWGVALTAAEKNIPSRSFPGHKMFYVHVGAYMSNSTPLELREVEEYSAGELAYKATKAFLELSPRLATKRYWGYKVPEFPVSTWVYSADWTDAP